MTRVMLAIDQGTTSTRAWRIGSDGTMALVGEHRHAQYYPQPGWVEHDAAELRDAVRGLIGRAGAVDGIGIANQGETVVAWDAVTRQPLGRAIVWQDTRTLDMIERLRADGLEPLVRARSGLPLDPYFSAAKLRWLLDHAPGARSLLAAGRLRLGTSDAFFLDSLAGRCVTDPSTASRTSLLDLATLRWDPALCAAFGVPIDCLPAIVDTAGDFGRLADGTPIRASVVDQQAALFGHGCRLPGELKITFGTGGFALAPAERLPAAQGGLLPTCAWRLGGETRYALDGGITTAGSAVEWLRGVGLLRDYAELGRYDGGSVAAGGLLFVPAQAGLGCPHWDRSARALWIGIDLATDRLALCRAVLEGIALRAAELVDAFADRLGPAHRISVDGGLTGSAYFTGFLATALGRPIEVCLTPDVTALGVGALCHGETAPPAPPFRRVEPAGALPGEVRTRFAEALRRARGWA